VVTGAGVCGALYGAAGAVNAASVSQAFQDGLLSGLHVGKEVLHVVRIEVRRPSPTASGSRIGTVGACSGRVQPTYWPTEWVEEVRNAVYSPTEWVEEVRNAVGARVARGSATCDLDLSTQSSGSPSSFRMATGMAATCDECHKVLSVGSDWYHERGTKRDLCARHRSELPPAQRKTFHCVDSERVLGSNSSAYALKVRVPVDAFPRVGPQAEGEVVLEVSHLINHKDGKETLASMLKPLMPNARIEEQPGPRSFCRISIDMKDEAAVREVIKSLESSATKG